MATNKIYIPTFISSVNYAPARVLPHIYFYNGKKSCEQYYIQGYGATTGSVVSRPVDAFPYFDNYEGQDPQSGSRSLLFFNEPAVYGTTPTGSLFTDYWETYVSLLYNPRTRLVNCEAIIPLADYFKMELNDIVEWRGNYYHLRAINEYNLSNGECQLQLLGPLYPPVISNLLPEKECGFDFTSSVFTPTTTTTTTLPPTVLYQVSFSANIGTRTFTYTDYNGTARSYDVPTNTPSGNQPRLLTFRFAAQKGSVGLPLGASLTLLQEPFTPNFLQYNVNFAPNQLPTYYIGYQEKAGNMQQYTNYTYVSPICIVSGSTTTTGATWTTNSPTPC